ncbi:hypothetical protein RYX36_007140 [Vicia faba]
MSEKPDNQRIFSELSGTYGHDFLMLLYEPELAVWEPIMDSASCLSVATGSASLWLMGEPNTKTAND